MPCSSIPADYNILAVVVESAYRISATSQSFPLHHNLPVGTRHIAVVEACRIRTAAAATAELVVEDIRHTAA